MSELKCCPFCGGEAKKTYVNFIPAIQCKECKATVFAKSWQEKDSEIELWNTRKPMEKIKEELKKTKETYGKLVLGYTTREEISVSIAKEQAIAVAIEIVEKGGAE